MGVVGVAHDYATALRALSASGEVTWAAVWGPSKQSVRDFCAEENAPGEVEAYEADWLDRMLERGQLDAVVVVTQDQLHADHAVRALQSAGAPRGLVGFTALPVLLARATLDHVERHGPGTSISRADVATLVGRLARDLDAGAPALL
jgi:hypothetical protein